MKLIHLSALSAAVMLASTVQANSFVDDSSLNIELRNHFQERYKKQSTKDTSSQWAQAVRADYSSGYLEGIFGVDLNAYYALKLGASNIDANANPGVLPKDSDGDSSSFGKTGYALKLNLMDMAELKYGRMELATPLLNDSDSRALPSMTEAFYGDVAVEGFSGYGAWGRKSSGRTDSGFTDYMYNGKKQPVKVVGAAYDFGNGLELSGDYGRQADFAKKYLTQIDYGQDLGQMAVGLGAQYANVSTIGAKKDESTDSSQKAYGVKADVAVDQITVGLAYTKVSDTTLGGFLNKWAGDGGKMDDTGFFGYNAVQYSDFNAQGQKAIGLSAGYDFEGTVDGLSVNAIYVTSNFKDGSGNKLDEKEYNIKLTYAVPQLEGLTAQLRYAENTTEESDSEDKVVKDTRLIVKYNVAVF